MKVLIIGSEGFIGHSCVKYYQHKGWDVYGCDLTDYHTGNYDYTKISRLTPDFDTLFSQVEYDACINAAGNGSVPMSITHPVNDFDANCADVIRILELIRQKNSSCKYLHISSAAVYGNPQKMPIKEDSPLSPISPYGWHKLIAEKLCEEYSKLYNISIAIVRPFSVYGPGLRKQLLWDMFQKANSSSLVELWGDGSETRDFIYIDDLLAAFYTILADIANGCKIYNVAAGEETSVAKIAEIFYKQVSNITYRFNGVVRPGDPKNWCADITKLVGLGYKASYTLEDGLKLTAEWLKRSG